MDITSLIGSQKTATEPVRVGVQDIVPQEFDSRSLTAAQGEELAQQLCTDLGSVPEASNFINVTTMQCEEPAQKQHVVVVGQIDTDVDTGRNMDKDDNDDDKELEGAIKTEAYEVTIGGRRVFLLKDPPSTNITEIPQKESVEQRFCPTSDDDEGNRRRVHRGKRRRFQIRSYSMRNPEMERKRICYTVSNI